MSGESYKNIFLFLIILLVGFIVCMGSTYAADTNGSCSPNCAHINSTNVESNYMTSHENLNDTLEYYNSTITTSKYMDEDNNDICCYNEEEVNNCTFEKSNESIKCCVSTNTISADCINCIKSISLDDINGSCSSNWAHTSPNKMDRYDDTHDIEPKDTFSTSIFNMPPFQSIFLRIFILSALYSLIV